MFDTITIPTLLIASPNMQCPYFSKSVVLLIDHNSKGSFGFVINNKTEYKLDEVLAENSVKVPENVAVWKAGPLQANSAFILHNEKSMAFETKVADNIYISASQESLSNILNKRFYYNNENLSCRELYPFRVLIGFSGWGPAQIEQEIKNGYWLIAPLNKEIIFNCPYQTIWKDALKSIGVECSNYQYHNDSNHMLN